MNKTRQELFEEIQSLRHEANVKLEAYNAENYRIQRPIEALESEMEALEDSDGEDTKSA